MLNPQARNEVLKLIDTLTEKELLVLKEIIEFTLSKVKEARDETIIRIWDEAPEDDEPLTEEDMRDIEEAESDIAEGRVMPWEKVKEELGL